MGPKTCQVLHISGLGQEAHLLGLPLRLGAGEVRDHLWRHEAGARLGRFVDATLVRCLFSAVTLGEPKRPPFGLERSPFFTSNDEGVLAFFFWRGGAGVPAALPFLFFLPRTRRREDASVAVGRRGVSGF